jgi:hypothetical protein
LRYIVERTLDGDHDRLKERTLGIEIFHRDPDYDSNSDPIVRRTAGEVRKRLNQYYQEEGNRTAIRLRLDAGSYQPHFDFEEQRDSSRDSESSELATLLTSPEFEGIRTDQVPVPGTLGRKWLFWSAAVLVVSIFALSVARAGFFRSTSYLVWKPFLDWNGDLTICVSDRLPELFIAALADAKSKAATGPTPDDEPTSTLLTTASRSRLKFLDVTTALKISNTLYAQARKSQSFLPLLSKRETLAISRSS